MFAICLECSHEKGMGHLFRMLNFVEFLKYKKQEFIFFINDNQKTRDILNVNKYHYETVDLFNSSDNWESALIKKYQINYWINDRLNTAKEHASNIKKTNCKLITFDDFGLGSNLSDINVCGLYFQNEKVMGKKVLKGSNYLILNQEIIQYRKQRNKIENILVSLGGSDTYGVTITVLKLLKKYGVKATIHLGPSFNHYKEFLQEVNVNYPVITQVYSLIEEFSKYDLAITGGGITPFEANASGLPCLIIANELFEIQTGIFLDTLRTSKFLGYYKDIDEKVFSNLFQLNIENMSLNGLLHIKLDAVEKIYREILS